MCFQMLWMAEGVSCLTLRYEGCGFIIYGVLGVITVPIMPSLNYQFEILLRGTDSALNDHTQTYSICESASVPKKLNKSPKC